MSEFKIELVTTRPVANRILEKVGIEKIKMEKTLGNSTIKSFNTNQSLANKLDDKADWESKLATANTDVANLPEGPAKAKAVVDKQEFEWRLNKQALAQEEEEAEDLVLAEFHKVVAQVSLPKAVQLITELTTHRGTLPE